MAAGYERYYQIARCFRDEDLRADRQPEFTQIDVEMSFVAEKDVMDAMEEMTAAIFAAANRPFPTPVPACLSPNPCNAMVATGRTCAILWN